MKNEFKIATFNLFWSFVHHLFSFYTKKVFLQDWEEKSLDKRANIKMNCDIIGFQGFSQDELKALILIVDIKSLL